MVSIEWRPIGSHTWAFQTTHYWTPKIQDGGDPPCWKSTWRCRRMSFSADEEMRFQASCEGGCGQCRQTQFSWYTVPSLRTGNSDRWLSVARRVCLRWPTAGVDVLWDERPAGRAQRDTGGDKPRRHLLTSIAILYCIRLATGSQCSCRCYASAAYAVMRCPFVRLCVCLSVRHVRGLCQNE